MTPEYTQFRVFVPLDGRPDGIERLGLERYGLEQTGVANVFDAPLSRGVVISCRVYELTPRTPQAETPPRPPKFMIEDDDDVVKVDEIVVPSDGVGGIEFVEVLRSSKGPEVPAAFEEKMLHAFKMRKFRAIYPVFSKERGDSSMVLLKYNGLPSMETEEALYRRLMEEFTHGFSFSVEQPISQPAETL